MRGMSAFLHIRMPVYDTWYLVYMYRIRRCMSHPPGPIFHGRYLHNSSWNSVNSVGAKEVSVGKISSRELSEDVPFGVDTGTLLVVKAITGVAV